LSSSRASARVAALALALLAAGCSNLPTADSIPTEGVEWIQTVAPGCEPPSADEALRAAVGDDPEQLAFARRVGAIETAITRKPMQSGNSVHLLVDGPATHAAQLEAIRAAQHHVHLEVYILTDEKIGQQYADALAERARAGVKVRLMFDGVGSLGAGAKYREELRKQGVEIEEINSVNPLEEPRVWRVNRRSHRKLLVVDGKVAFTGGVNIMDEYAASSSGSSSAEGSSGSSGSSSSSDEGSAAGSTDGKGVGGSRSRGSRGSGAPRLGWRDTHIRVEGPAVADFQREFLRNWEEGKGKIDPSSDYWPSSPARGNNLVRVIGTEGADFLGLALGVPQKLVRQLLGKRKRSSPIYASYISAIQEARRRIWITQAYFAPSDELVKVLGKAAERGVDVRIVVPARSDTKLLPLAARYYYDRMLEAGIKLYEYDPVMIHAKTAVVDGVWSTVGSSNLDFRSLIHNDEANAIIIGREFGREMEELFERDLAQSTQVTLEQWEDRPLFDRVKEAGAAAIKYWM
jgi:cardiolipin synthase A/B